MKRILCIALMFNTGCGALMSVEKHTMSVNRLKKRITNKDKVISLEAIPLNNTVNQYEMQINI